MVTIAKILKVELNHLILFKVITKHVIKENAEVQIKITKQVSSEEKWL